MNPHAVKAILEYSATPLAGVDIVWGDNIVWGDSLLLSDTASVLAAACAQEACQ